MYWLILADLSFLKIILLNNLLSYKKLPLILMKKGVIIIRQTQIFIKE